MAFYRIKASKDGKRRYLYREERWWDGTKVRSKSRCLGRVDGGRPRATIGEAAAIAVHGILGSPLLMVPALPFMIAHDLATGRRVEELKAELAARAHKPSTPARGWVREKWTPPTIEQVQASAAKSAANHPVTPRSPMFDIFEARLAIGQAEQRARDEYLSLCDQNRAQIASYNAKVTEAYEAKDKARADWDAEQAGKGGQAGSDSDESGEPP